MANPFKIGDVVIRKHSEHDGMWIVRDGTFSPMIVRQLYPYGISLEGMKAENWGYEYFELVGHHDINEYI